MIRYFRVIGAAAAVSLAFSMLGASSVGATGRVAGHSATASQLTLKHAGYLTVGSDTTYPPMESINPSTHKAVGADVDLANALAHAMHLHGAIIVTTAFDTIIPSLNRGNFDIVMSSLSDTAERRKQIAFVDYMRANEGIVVKKSSSIHGDSYHAVCGLSVSVQSGTTEFMGMQDANKHCAKKINIKGYVQDTAAYQAFASGHADAYTSDLPVCAYYIKGSSALRLAGKTFGAGGDYGIGVPYHNKGLITALKAALKVIRANGQYSRILNKWGVNGASL